MMDQPTRLRISGLGEIGGQWIQFCLIGGLNTVIHIAAYQVLILIGSPYLIASACGYGLGLANSFVLNRRFTFRKQISHRWGPELFRFVIVNAVALAANLGLLSAIVTSGLLNEKVAVLPSVLGSLVVNFVGNKYWTFRGGTR